MTHTTHRRGERGLVRLGIVTMLALGLAGCGVAGKPGGGPSGENGVGPDQGVGTVSELPGGGTDGGETATPAPAATPPLVVVAQPAPEDCVSYNPSNLTVAALGDAWVLKDGNHNMKLFDTKSDADNGLKVARNWKQLCFIGRDNSKPDRYRYIIDYWKTASGLPVGLAPTLACVTYNPAQLTIYSGVAHPADPSQDEWALYAGPIPLLFLASEADALRAKIVASGYTQRCIIGHGNDRPDPSRYLMYHWRQ
jgi:hypothetical protein